MDQPTQAAVPPDDAHIPLCVDLDGTLVRTDLAWESAGALVKRDPSLFFKIPFWLLTTGRTGVKARLAALHPLDPKTLPYRQEVLDLVATVRAAGRPVVLATAADESFARAVAGHLGVFDGVFASDGTVNLKGPHKLEALKKAYPGGFDYVGDSTADVPIFSASRKAYMVEPTLAVQVAAKKWPDAGMLVRRTTNDNFEIFKLLRPHQWFKNLLIFVPLIMAHKVQNSTLVIHSVIAFYAFCMAASCVYVINDLLDVADDRQHPKKMRRPIASGAVTPQLAAGAAIWLFVLSFSVAGFALPWRFSFWLAFYFATSLAYCVVLKRKLLIDVFALAGLYTLRILAGGGAVMVPISPWLMAFSMFIFTSLAFAKRVVELQMQAARGQDKLAGRGYGSADIPVLTVAGASTGYAAILVFALYISSEIVTKLYPSPFALWLICPLMMYWITRVWIFVGRGKLDDDPVKFAMRDRVSWYVAGAVAVLMVIASTHWLGTT